MDELFEPYTPDAWILGNAAREQLWQFPPLPDEKVHTIIAYRYALETDLIAALTTPSQQAAVRTVLYEFAAAVHETTGTFLSRPYQCAYFLLSVFYMPLLQSALAERERQPAAFIALYDYASGMSAVTYDVFIAEGERKGVAKSCARQAIALTGEEMLRKPLPEAIAEQAYTRLRARGKQAGQLLSLDPTGKTLIAAAVNDIRIEVEHPDKTDGTRRIQPYQNAQPFLAGAEYAQRLYTALYPLSQ